MSKKITLSQEKELNKIVKKMKTENIDHLVINDGAKYALYSDEVFDLFDLWNNEVSEESKKNIVQDIVSELSF